MFWLPAKNVGWLITLLPSMRSSMACRSVICTLFIRLASRLNDEGPSNILFCSVPMFPAVGLKKTWPLNGAVPGSATPDPLAGLMADRRHDHRSVAGHLEFHNVGELRSGQGGVGRVPHRSRAVGAVERAPAGQDRNGRARLPGENAAEGPSADDSVEPAGVDRMALAEGQVVGHGSLERVRQVEDARDALDRRLARGPENARCGSG